MRVAVATTLIIQTWLNGAMSGTGSFGSSFKHQEAIMSFLAGIIIGGIVGGTFGLGIATLMIGSGRASEDERIAAREKERTKIKY